MSGPRRQLGLALAVLGCVASGQAAGVPKFKLTSGSLELSGEANPRRFVNAVGERAGIWGFESGKLEAWVYPLKIFHDFQLSFQIEGTPEPYPGDAIVRSVRVHPHMVQLLYSAEGFTVRQTLFAARNEPGIAILLEVDTPAPLRIHARFRPVLNLMWPAAVGAQSFAWNADRKWLRMAEGTGRFSALVGSPAAVACSATGYHPYLTDERPYETLELHVTPQEAKTHYLPIIIAGGIRGVYDSAATYDRILGNLPELYEEQRRHFAGAEAGTEFRTPDAGVNEAVRWARVALEQLRVTNPYVGTSYVSGYGSSGTGTRPMYAWFFDEPTITGYAFLPLGGAEGVKEAFRFIQKYQREDGKIPHEVSQSAGVIDWFRNYPYAYIHPDSPLWYIVCFHYCYRFMGDQGFLKEGWPSVRKAYAYGTSIVDPTDGLPRIPRGEWGSMETSEFAKDASMAGIWIAVLRAMPELSAAAGEPGLDDFAAREKQATESLERVFWNRESQYYDYGLYASGKAATFLNPMIGYGALFGALPENRARAVLERLATASMLTDWGQRNMSLDDDRYSEGSYTSGSVWPFMTAAPILAQFRHHNSIQAFRTWMSMVRLRSLNARGAMPEVLSGHSYRMLENGVPHQMFSEVAVVPGLFHGVLGLDFDVPKQRLVLAPHLPPDWPEVSVRRCPYGTARIDFLVRNDPGKLAAEISKFGTEPLSLVFSPALPPGSKVSEVLLDGKAVPFEIEDKESDLHVRVEARLESRVRFEVRYRHGVSFAPAWLPVLEGESSRNLRIIRTTFREGVLEAVLEGLPDFSYPAQIRTERRLERMSGGTVTERFQGGYSVELSAPADGRTDRAGYTRWVARLRFAE